MKDKPYLTGVVAVFLLTLLGFISPWYVRAIIGLPATAALMMWAHWQDERNKESKAHAKRELEKTRNDMQNRLFCEFDRVIKKNELRNTMFPVFLGEQLSILIHCSATHPHVDHLFDVRFGEEAIKMRVVDGKLYGARYSDEFQIRSLIETGSEAIISLVYKDTTNPQNLAEIEHEFSRKWDQGFFDT